MVTIVRFTILFFLLLVQVNHLTTLEHATKSKSDLCSTILDNDMILENPRQLALKTLKDKCNVCHIKQNKRRVFTYKNMDDFATDIYEQVYIKKRMPRGKEIKLTSEEYQIILTWISSIKNNKNGTKF